MHISLSACYPAVFPLEEHESSASTATTDSSAEQQEKKTQMGMHSYLLSHLLTENNKDFWIFHYPSLFFLCFSGIF